MAYRIAVGSSDGDTVDLKFGEVDEFIIYEADGKNYRQIEKRKFKSEVQNTKGSCNQGASCGQGGSCGGQGGGCNGPADVASKVLLIEDCRCVVCKKIGFQAQKQFEKKAITVFDVDCRVSEALDKITFYYDKLDKGKSLRAEH